MCNLFCMRILLSPVGVCKILITITISIAFESAVLAVIRRPSETATSILVAGSSQHETVAIDNALTSAAETTGWLIAHLVLLCLALVATHTTTIWLTCSAPRGKRAPSAASKLYYHEQPVNYRSNSRQQQQPHHYYRHEYESDDDSVSLRQQEPLSVTRLSTIDLFLTAFTGAGVGATSARLLTQLYWPTSSFLFHFQTNISYKQTDYYYWNCAADGGGEDAGNRAFCRAVQVAAVCGVLTASLLFFNTILALYACCRARQGADEERRLLNSQWSVSSSTYSFAPYF